MRRPVTVMGDTGLMDSEEPLFGQQIGQEVKLKSRKVRTVASDVEIVE